MLVSLDTEQDFVIHSDVELDSVDLTDVFKDKHYIDLLFPVISTESSDNEISLLPDSAPESPNIVEGNIPDLERLGVDKAENTFEKRLSERINRSFSYPITTSSILPVESLNFDILKNDFEIDSDNFGASVSAYNHSLRKRSSTEVLKQRKLPIFCNTSVQSALVSKLDSKRSTSTEGDVEKHLQQYDLINTWLNENKGFYTKGFDADKSDVDKLKTPPGPDVSMTSLLKEELKYKIQVERMKKGEPEVVLEPEKPKLYQLRPDEIKKKTVRLQQNRLSARRSRIKAISHRKQLEKTIKEEMTKTVELRKEINHLIILRNVLKREYDEHMKVCPTRTRHYTV